MPVRRSAGLLVYRVGASGVEVLLGHMGGPLWARRDEGGWTLPKGEYDAASEEPLAAARREFTEELGLPAPDGAVLSLGEVVQAGGKRVVAFAVEGDLDPDTVVPGTFEMVWPPRSGRVQSFPELDRFAWFALADAAPKLIKAQREFLDRLAAALS
ncbi:MAG: NUDIX domain-containing protein [Geodermatophilaceae bacterium]|nr:NUDIX domain-containing protein [Geodermatophilaceae bacterium]